MDNELSINRNVNGMFALNREAVDLIKRTIAPTLTDIELQLFLYVSQRTGLDPIARQIYAVKRWTKDGEKMTIQTGIDGFRVVANRAGLSGVDDAVFDDETGEHPNKATVTVWRMVDGQRVSYTATARWKEYVVEKNLLWSKMPFAMLAKCAEALALRKGFPAELSGIYSSDEMEKASDASDSVVPLDDASVMAYTFTLKSLGKKTVKEILSMTGGLDKIEKLATMTKGIEKQVCERAIVIAASDNVMKEVVDADVAGELPFKLYPTEG